MRAVSVAALTAGVILLALAWRAGPRQAGDLPTAHASPSGIPSGTAPSVATVGAVGATPTSPPSTASPALAVARPVGVTIPAIGVAAPVIGLGTASDGSLQVPTDVTQAGWYTAGPAPGALGAAVIVGHLDNWKGPGVFARLAELVPGDRVSVQRADGTSASFTVTGLEQVPKSRFPTQDVYGPVPGSELRLITCGGTFSSTTRHYEDNVLVFATLS